MQLKRPRTEMEMVEHRFEDTYGEPPDMTNYLGVFGTTSLYLIGSSVTVAFLTISNGSDTLVASGLHSTIIETIKKHEEYYSIDEDERYK